MKKLLTLTMLLLCSVTLVLAQRTVTGNVSDDNDVPLIGANVVVVGTSTGTVTDIDGNFSLEVPAGYDVLSISYTGYSTLEVDIPENNKIDVALTEGVTLETAVVTGMGISRDQKSLGYAVQELEGDALAQSKEDNIINALQGQIAGVQIQGSPSTIGGSSRITIRGSNSFLGNNQPLFVVDGVPIDNSNFATDAQQRGFGGAQAYDYGNTAQDIDPNSIKSMSVLKGAAATAIYGQRGANGVILITTKDGSANRGIGIDVNSSFTVDEVTNLIPMQTAYGGGAINTATDHGMFELIQDGQSYLYPAYGKDGSWGPKYDPSLLVRHWDSWDPNSPNYKETRPWVAPANTYDKYFDKGITYNNSIGLSGGNEDGSFRLGYTNVDKSGVIPNGKYRKNAVTFNSRYNLHERISAGISGNYVNTRVENRNVTGYNNGNPLQAFTQWWQTQLDVERLKEYQTRFDGGQQTWNATGPVVDGDGNFQYFDFSPNYFDNPFWVRNNFLQEDVRDRFFGNTHLEIELAEGLKLRGQFGTDFYQLSAREGVPVESVDVSFYGETERRFNETNLEGRLTYEKRFDRISFTGLAGVNRMRQFNRRSSADTGSGGLSLPGFYNLANSASPVENETAEFRKGINSVFGSASIGFDDWIYLDVAARNDWSSTLPEGENSYFYPSVSVSAVLSDVFNLPTNIISFAKVRASYAQAGNDADPYRLTPVFSATVPNVQGAPRYGIPNAQPNPLLKPELTSEMEFGVDLRLFDNRVGFDLAYFDRTTENQIFNVPSSSATGYTSRTLNAGEMRNWGFEATINITPIQTQNFNWRIGLNFYDQNNKVVELLKDPETGETIVESINMGGTWAADLRIAEDLPYMAIFGQDYMRNDDGERLVGEDGAYLFTDERVYLGTAIADWTGGFNTQIDFKGFYASGLLDWQIGGSIHSTSLQWSKYSGMHPETVEFNGISDVRADADPNDDVVGGLLLPGVYENGEPNTTYLNPLQYYQTYWNVAAPNVYDATYLKLREIRFGYRFNKNLLNNTPFKNLELGVFGRNLAILYSKLPYLDPQGVTGAGNVQGLENAQVPPVKSFGVNLLAKF